VNKRREMLAVSSGSRYALRALLELAGQNTGNPVSIQALAKAQGISPKYLESIFNQLKRAGIVRSFKGPRGGYRLSREPEQITLFEIVEAVDGPLMTVRCVEDPSTCDRAENCIARIVWGDLMDHMVDFLKAKTLANVLSHTGTTPIFQHV
jgi:Rrf2 family protein